jgi:hypothetical protein
MFYAARAGHLAVVEHLVDQGADMEAQDEVRALRLRRLRWTGGSSMLFAGLRLSTEACAFAFGLMTFSLAAQCNSRPLHEAVRGGCLAVVKYLVGAGAEIDAADKVRACTSHGADRACVSGML